MSFPQSTISLMSSISSNTFDGSEYTFWIRYEYDFEWMVSENVQAESQSSSSGSEQIGPNAMVGARPCTESRRICRFRFDVKMCCSCLLSALKSLASRPTSTSCGRQKKPCCFSVSLSSHAYLWRS